VNHAHRARRSSAQAGVTLVEILVVIAVVTPVILSATLGMFTAITASGSAESRTELEAALTSYGEALRSVPAYISCATPEQYTAGHAATPEAQADVAAGGVNGVDGVETRVMHVRYWNQATATFDERCTADGGAQQLTLQARRGADTLDGVIVRRNIAAVPTGSP